MAFTLNQFIEKLPERRANMPGAQRCAECNTPLQETLTGNRKTAKGHVCSKCYFEAFGDELDSHPIVMPRAIRGS